ncbi:uncharacterized protein [Heptranchias perlo]|uniref:uncharacterized protein isoform X2 n=1 Tax=Heptranchias perlo TaxID=212740 RepID=UPI0035595C5C
MTACFSVGPAELEGQRLNQQVAELHLGGRGTLGCIGHGDGQHSYGAATSTLATEPLVPAPNLSHPETACGPRGASCANRTSAEGAGVGCPPIAKGDAAPRPTGGPAAPGSAPDATESAQGGLAKAESSSDERTAMGQSKERTVPVAKAPSPQGGPRSTAASGQHLDLERGSGELKRAGSGTQLAEGPLDNLDCDSRPSSGFYDVSESTSCSLSNSCCSVYSECPSSSRWSMQSLSQLPRGSGNWSRPRSTDEATVRLMDLRSQRFLCSLGARASDESAGSGADKRSKVSQRPVSTGDLNFLSRYLSVDPVSSQLSCCRGPWNPERPGPGPDPKYQCDLVSRNSNEVYHYPSPLHAVALQSPLFTASSCRRSPSKEDLTSRAAGVKTAAGLPPEAVPLPSQGRLDKYICGLVLRFKCRPAPRRSELASHPKSLSMSSVYSQSSSALGAAPLVSPAGGWKVRRRISTCCQAADRARSPDWSGSGSDASSSLEACPLSGPGPSVEGLFPPPEASDSPAAADPEGLLYRGKHLSRELVRCPASGLDRDTGREGGRRTDLFKRMSARGKSGGRSSSEMNLHSAACQRPEALCGFECRPSPAKGKQKWTSVLEIPGRCKPKRPGLLGQAQAFLSRRHRAFSADSPASSLRAGVLEASREDLRACGCQGDGCHGRADWAETLPRASVAMETRFHRSKSFKELRKKVQLSIRPWSLKVNNASK